MKRLFPLRARDHRARSRACALLALALAVIALTLAAAPRQAHAQVEHRLAIRGEFGIGAMLPSYQRQTLGLDIALQGTGRFAISLIDPLALQISFSSWFFTGTPLAGQIFAPTIGLRFEPRVGRVGRFFLDFNIGPGWTPDRWRPYGDLGLGFEFNIGSIFSLGPVARAGILIPVPNDYPSPAVFITGGISMTLRFGPGDRAAREREARDNERRRERERPRRVARDRDRERDRARERDRERERERDRERERVREQERERERERTRDPDNDGVLGDADRCPNTPAGRHPDPDRPGCPDGDADDDDVPDHVDQCPHQADGLHPDPARPGCPLPDRDDDNVPDNRDACPTRPGAPSSNPRLNGCPGLVRVQNNVIIILQPVYFAPNHERILPRSEAVLRAVAEAIRENPRIGRVSIDGHTDETGASDTNLELSQRRADSVRDWLVAHGVDRDRLETHGYGERRPAVEGNTPRALAANRRVEFHIVGRRR